MSQVFQDTARRVIRIEIDALQQLEQSIDDSFAKAVDLMIAATGRIIVCGMGKSGHIARKIAATLASTGTPAHFVHPAEASHGDLGMMGAGDVVIVLSNSGETPELADVIAYTRRFAIPMIGVASRPESTLLRQSDVALILPRAQEACGTGIVPTSSTTMTLALGDALAVALMEHRQFTPEHFRNFHPGGKLGAQLSKVADLMHTGDAVPVVSGNAPMSDALREIGQKGFGVVAVSDPQGRLQGIITNGDISRHMDGLASFEANNVMTPSPITITPDALAEQAVGIMNDKKITCLLVVDPEVPQKLIGLIHIHDCLRVGLG
ncbi:KpsF/GutQ family sugar-phosphate isomerase [Roseobacter litoralis]|uniref:Arabinose 5-phosphate isomerase KdsD n=1 Tax=Roseobacter litoralis (strain ATCC 49566 / DSM 6996 / JCM 21268 / NBRC 15278 / OCh 149) TaxID=391595 RepID=F7ZH97_ROSLO|nr:KpsF/GutQ family sugar-phosphate isomerase [Roseobacter litoralis]AEI96125.1 arabinose 5-phosphate isomerase KdsD [Roseobacter litoralis Och 149]